MKICARCKEHKSFSEFGIHRSQRDGYRSWCKVCRRTERGRSRRSGVRHGTPSLASRKRNAERQTERNAERRARDPEGVKLYDRNQYLKHREKQKARGVARHEIAPYKRQARTAISLLVKRGGLSLAKYYRCVKCGNQALDFHHPSYRVEDQLNVVPLCRPCHIKTHKSTGLQQRLGIVVLNMGIVRIAIAGID